MKVEPPMSINLKASTSDRTRRNLRSVSHLAPVVISLASFAAFTVATPAGATKAAPTVALNESSNAHTLNVGVGTHLNLTLHSTYWTLATTKLAPYLKQVGTTSVVGVAPNGGGHCVPGQGCGTVSAHFVAAHPGTVHLRATRTSCGEAMKCSPAQSLWTVTIQVR